MLRCASRLSTAAYSPGLLKLLFTSARLSGSIDSMPMNTHLQPDSAIRSTNSSSRSRLALICAIHGNCASAAMMSRSKDLVRLILIAKLSSIKKIVILPRSGRGIFNNLRPRLIGFAEGDRIRMSWLAVSTQRFIGHFGHMGAAHYYRHAGSANGVGHPVGLLNHSGHRADADQANVLFAKEPHQLLIV